MNNDDFLLESYQYHLPPELIAQHPAPQRDASRLLVMNGREGAPADRMFGELPELFRAGDLLVRNNTRVFPARLLGRKASGGRVELLLLEYPRPEEAGPAAASGRGSAAAVGLLKSSKRCRPGTEIVFGDDLTGEVTELAEGGRARFRLVYGGELADCLARYGRMPLPPYINRQAGESAEDRQRYQTVYARETGAVAAPTAGLHFSEALFARLEAAGVGMAEITLHVGYGTFSPVRTADIREHAIHAEHLEVSAATAALVNATRAAGGRVWAVGTTTVRGLEAAADRAGLAQPRRGPCDLYIYPGHVFRAVDNLITNFHLPGSSLLFLVSALVGRERILQAYTHAVARRYRFFSYGDAMAIVVK